MLAKWPLSTLKPASRHRLDLYPGVKVRGNARAGSGKTTMARLLCETHLKKHRYDSIAYFVFGKINADEAQSSGKFNQGRVAIRTTHSLAKEHVFKKSEPRANLDRLDISKLFRLYGQVQDRLQAKGAR